MFSGRRAVALHGVRAGIMPYISASIIMQLMTYVVPDARAMKKEGEAGRRKITQYTATAPWPGAVPVAGHRRGAGRLRKGWSSEPGFGFRMTAVVSLTPAPCS